MRGNSFEWPALFINIEILRAGNFLIISEMALSTSTALPTSHLNQLKEFFKTDGRKQILNAALRSFKLML